MASSTRTDAASRRGDKTPAQLFAYLTGAVLVLAGILGFIADSSFNTGSGIDGDKLLGILEINGIHNLVHIASGLFLLAVAPKRATARTGVLAFGAIYAIVTVIGLIDGDDVLGLLPVNPADNVLHIALTAAALLAGAVSSSDDDARAADRTVATPG
ncbi:MAG: DUF4383 domain-containing protein [Actinomycetota bacterium]|nr:DUF4383 domain-containing protein [Actinomycetota bacterium]